jgi:predicted metal-dependent peptidase
MFNFSFFSNSEKRLHLARQVLVDRCPFFASIALNMNFIKDTQGKTETCGIEYYEYNGFAFYYNDKFVKSMKFEKLCTIFAHEILHIGLMHFLRGKGLVKDVWNEACDLIVNGLLRQYGYSHLPTSKYDAQLGDCSKYTVEQIYGWLINQPQNKNKKPPNSSEDSDENQMEYQVRKLMQKTMIQHGKKIKAERIGDNY